MSCLLYDAFDTCLSKISPSTFAFVAINLGVRQGQHILETSALATLKGRLLSSGRFADYYEQVVNLCLEAMDIRFESVDILV